MQFTPHLSPRSTRAGTAILLVAVLALVAACGLSSAAPAAPIATATANQVVTVAAASPSVTAIPPTPTPAPVSTPTSAVATAPPPIAALSETPLANSGQPLANSGQPLANSGQYLADLREISGRWQAWSDAANALMGEVGQDPLAVCITRSGDIDAQVAGGRGLLADLANCSPPEDIVAEHNRLVSEGAAGLDALTAGKEALCRRLDAGTAMAKMEEVNTHLVEAYAAAEALFAWAQEAEASG